CALPISTAARTPRSFPLRSQCPVRLSRTRLIRLKMSHWRQVKARNPLVALFDLDFALFGPFLQGCTQIFRRGFEPPGHRLADFLHVDLADQLLDRADRGRSYRQPRDPEAEQRQRLEPPSAHLAAYAELHRVAGRGRDDTAQEPQDRRAEPVVTLRELRIGAVGREQELRQ